VCLKAEKRDESRSGRELVFEVSRWLEKTKAHKARRRIDAPTNICDVRFADDIRSEDCLITYPNLCSEWALVAHCEAGAVKAL
jgi:hypothetical protein